MKILILTGLCLPMLMSVAWATDDDGTDGKVRSAFVSTAAQQALDRYLAEIEDIERVAQQRRERARRRLGDALRQTERAEAERGPRFHGMLGSYQDSAGPIPYVLLSVPDGSNVLSKRFWDGINRGYGVKEPLYRFEAHGHVKIPAKGAYRLETGRGYGQVMLNGTSYALRQENPGEPLYAVVELDQGVQEVYFSIGNNGGQMNEAMLRIRDATGGEPLPIFVYASDLKKFLNDLSLGVELTEVSGWTKKRNRIK